MERAGKEYICPICIERGKLEKEVRAANRSEMGTFCVGLLVKLEKTYTLFVGTQHTLFVVCTLLHSRVCVQNVYAFSISFQDGASG